MYPTKDDILSIMRTIIDKELNKKATLQQATYNDQKLLIRQLFDPKMGYNKGIIMLRLVVIDSLYSTNAAYSYFSFEEMADKIYNLLGKSEKGARQYFYDIVCGLTDKHNLFQEPFGIQKNLSEGSRQMSLLSKYAYYALDGDKQKYPLGFPIYDSLAIESYPTICKILDIPQKTKITEDIYKYVDALDMVRQKLFGNDELFEKYQQFDILDAYLWRMGKFSGGNLSLLLGRVDYVKFVQNLGLDKVNIIDDENEKFDFNDMVVRLYKEENAKPFAQTSCEDYMDALLKHWRAFNHVKETKSASYAPSVSKQQKINTPTKGKIHKINNVSINIVKK